MKRLFVVLLLLGISRIANADTELWFPFDHYREVTCGFGCYEGHQGVDYSCPGGTYVYASIGGTVVTVENNVPGQNCVGFGNYVKIESADHTVQVIEAHMLQGSIVVTSGNTVVPGQYLGQSSNSGYTTTLIGGEYLCGYGGGYHLHLETRVKVGNDWVAVDPYTYNGGMWTDPLMYGSPYSCFYNTQDPDNLITLEQGETREFVVSYTNTGTTDWKNSGGVGNPDYIELRSCNSNGTIVDSWLYHSSWINAQRVVAPNASNVAPGENAWFIFTGKVPENQSPGTYPVYFRPYHATGELIQDWAGMHFLVEVVEPPLPPSGDETPDIIRMREVNGNWTFRVAASDNQGNTEVLSYQGSPYWLSIDWQPDAWFVADVHNDGLADLVLVRGNDIYLSKSYRDYFRSPPLLWKNDWGTPTGVHGYLPWMYYGDSRVDLAHYRAISQTQVRWWGLKAMSGYYADLGVLSGNFGNRNDEFFAVGSFHGLRREDIIFGRRNPGGNQLKYRVARQKNDGTFQDAGWWINAFGFYYSTILVADINGDDYDDLVAVTHQGNNKMRVTWAENLKNQSFASGLELHPDYGNNGNRYYAADVNVDGRDDIVMVGQNGNIYWAETYREGSSWKLSNQRTWLNYFAQGANDQFWFANVTNQAPAQQGVQGGGDELLLERGAQASTVSGPEPKKPSLVTYPNPVAGKATISFTVLEAQKVTVVVYNLRGQRVRKLYESTAGSEPTKVVWDGKTDDGRRLPTGIYIIHLQTSKKSLKQKIVLLQ